MNEQLAVAVAGRLQLIEPFLPKKSDCVHDKWRDPYCYEGWLYATDGKQCARIVAPEGCLQGRLTMEGVVPDLLTPRSLPPMFSGAETFQVEAQTSVWKVSLNRWLEVQKALCLLDEVEDYVPKPRFDELRELRLEANNGRLFVEPARLRNPSPEMRRAVIREGLHGVTHKLNTGPLLIDGLALLKAIQTFSKQGPALRTVLGYCGTSGKLVLKAGSMEWVTLTKREPLVTCE